MYHQMLECYWQTRMKTANSEIQEAFRCVVSMQRYRFSSKVEHNHVIMNFPNFGFQANIVKSCSQWCSGLSDVVGDVISINGVAPCFVRMVDHHSAAMWTFVTSLRMRSPSQETPRSGTPSP